MPDKYPDAWSIRVIQGVSLNAGIRDRYQDPVNIMIVQRATTPRP
jgi:hypothetical protein